MTPNNPKWVYRPPSKRYLQLEALAVLFVGGAVLYTLGLTTYGLFRAVVRVVSTIAGWLLM
jgi:hypothetical protein